MKEPLKFEIDGKQVTFFKNEDKGAPIIYANMHTEVGHSVIEQCKKLGCRPFHLVSITGLRWDEELSPWAHDPIVSKNDHFTGEADHYVRCMTDKIIPFIEDEINPPTCRIIAGYSMGGLFTLYAPYITDAFTGSVSASGSVWYPEFVSYAKEHDFLQRPEAIYLSLGDLESRAKNPFLSQAENCMKELYSLYQRKAIKSVFELNPGNHFRDVPYRLAKGITWMLITVTPSSS